MNRIHVELIYGMPQPSGPSSPIHFRVFTTNDRENPLEVELGIFTEQELIFSLANIVNALADARE